MADFVAPDGSPEGDAELERWVDFHDRQLGEQRALHRVPSPGRPLVLLAAVGLMVLLLVTVMLAALGVLSTGVVVVIGAVAMLPVLVLAGVGLRSSARRDISVHRHGLLVSGRAVPFATMDPGRMYWATDLDAVRRVVTLNRRRVAVRGDVLLLNATDGSSGEEDWRELEKPAERDVSPAADRMDTPFVWWCLGPRDVGAFVTDLEAALVDDGYPAQGLARRLAASRGLPDGDGEAFPRRGRYDPLLAQR